MTTPELDIQEIRNQIAQAQERGETGSIISISALGVLLETARESCTGEAHQVAVELLGLHAGVLAARQEGLAHLSHTVLNFMIEIVSPAAAVEAVHAA